MSHKNFKPFHFVMSSGMYFTVGISTQVLFSFCYLISFQVVVWKLTGCYNFGLDCRIPGHLFESLFSSFFKAHRHMYEVAGYSAIAPNFVTGHGQTIELNICC